MTFKTAIGSFALIILVSSCNLPASYVYLGRQVPKEYVQELRDLGLLYYGEEIQYFYSIGFPDIRDGLYFVTDKKLVVYDNEWEKPDIVVRFNQIRDLEIIRSENLLIDSNIIVSTDDFQFEFPVSIEKNRDLAFFEYLVKKSNVKDPIIRKSN